MTVSIDDYIQELNCIYKKEQYTVRDNGAVLRHPQKGKRLRKFDNIWTFGKPNSNGYMLISSEVIHRIVATAFHGEAPTPQHIVDHIDTNRQNNRPENLRWLTKLENVLNNPITRKRIELCCGSIESFLENPSILNKYKSEDPNFNWMRTVTPEEAKTSWLHLSEWANKETNSKSDNRGSLGEWVFNKSQSLPHPPTNSDLTTSQTRNAVQRNWKTPSEFPLCPKDKEEASIASYAENLETGGIFSSNQYSSSLILNYALSENQSTLWVMTKSSQEDAIKPWALAEVKLENDVFIHTSLGSFMTETGAEKKFTIVQGLEWTGEDSIDDYM